MKPALPTPQNPRSSRLRKFFTLTGIFTGITALGISCIAPIATAADNNEVTMTSMQLTLGSDQSVSRHTIFHFLTTPDSKTGCSNPLVAKFIEENKATSPQCKVQKQDVVVDEDLDGDQTFTTPKITVHWNSDKEEVIVKKPAVAVDYDTVFSIQFPGKIIKPANPENTDSTENSYLGSLSEKVDYTASYIADSAIFSWGLLILSIVFPVCIIGCGAYFIFLRRRQVLEAQATRNFKPHMNELLYPFEKNKSPRTASFRLPRLPARPKMGAAPVVTPPRKSIRANTPKKSLSATPIPPVHLHSTTGRGKPGSTTTGAPIPRKPIVPAANGRNPLPRNPIEDKGTSVTATRPKLSSPVGISEDENQPTRMIPTQPKLNPNLPAANLEQTRLASGNNLEQTRMIKKPNQK